jgi:hypothetical protein
MVVLVRPLGAPGLACLASYCCVLAATVAVVFDADQLFVTIDAEILGDGTDWVAQLLSWRVWVACVAPYAFPLCLWISAVVVTSVSAIRCGNLASSSGVFKIPLQTRIPRFGLALAADVLRIIFAYQGLDPRLCANIGIRADDERFGFFYAPSKHGQQSGSSAFCCHHNPESVVDGIVLGELNRIARRRSAILKHVDVLWLLIWSPELLQIRLRFAIDQFIVPYAAIRVRR